MRLGQGKQRMIHEFPKGKAGGMARQTWALGGWKVEEQIRAKKSYLEADCDSYVLIFS